MTPASSAVFAASDSFSPVQPVNSMPAGVVAPLASTVTLSATQYTSIAGLGPTIFHWEPASLPPLVSTLFQVTSVGVSEIALLSPGFSFSSMAPVASPLAQPPFHVTLPLASIVNWYRVLLIAYPSGAVVSWSQYVPASRPPTLNLPAAVSISHFTPGRPFSPSAAVQEMAFAPSSIAFSATPSASLGCGSSAGVAFSLSTAASFDWAAAAADAGQPAGAVETCESLYRFTTCTSLPVNLKSLLFDPWYHLLVLVFSSSPWNKNSVPGDCFGNMAYT